MGRILFLRHGESIANAEERFTQGPHEGLSERGRQEARERAEALAAVARPDHLYTSPFVRARQTAALLAAPFGLEPRVVDALREQHFGALRGRPYAALGDNTRHGLARWDYRPPEGETLREVAERVGPAVLGLADAHRGEEIIVVSHGGVMAAIEAWLDGGFSRAPSLAANAGGFWLDHSTEAGFGARAPIESLAARGVR